MNAYGLNEETKKIIGKKVEREGFRSQEMQMPTSVNQAMEESNKDVIRNLYPIILDYCKDLPQFTDLQGLLDHILKSETGVLTILKQNYNPSLATLRGHFREFSLRLERFSQYQLAQKIMDQFIIRLLTNKDIDVEAVDYIPALETWRDCYGEFSSRLQDTVNNPSAQEIFDLFIKKRLDDWNANVVVQTVVLAYIFENNQHAKVFFDQYMDTCKNIDNLIQGFLSNQKYDLLHDVFRDLVEDIRKNSSSFIQSNNKSLHSFVMLVKNYSNPKLEVKYGNLERENVMQTEDYEDFIQDKKYKDQNWILKYALKVFRRYVQEVDENYQVFGE